MISKTFDRAAGYPDGWKWRGSQGLSSPAANCLNPPDGAIQTTVRKKGYFGIIIERPEYENGDFSFESPRVRITGAALLGKEDPSDSSKYTSDCKSTASPLGACMSVLAQATFANAKACDRAATAVHWVWIINGRSDGASVVEISPNKLACQIMNFSNGEGVANCDLKNNPDLQKSFKEAIEQRKQRKAK